MRIPRRSLLQGALAVVPGLAMAQPVTLPDRPITLVVPFPPGGSVDGVARILAQELGEQTAGTFIVENRAGGAGGAVGSEPMNLSIRYDLRIHRLLRVG